MRDSQPSTLPNHTLEKLKLISIYEDSQNLTCLTTTFNAWPSQRYTTIFPFYSAYVNLRTNLVKKTEENNTSYHHPARMNSMLVFGCYPCQQVPSFEKPPTTQRCVKVFQLTFNIIKRPQLRVLHINSPRLRHFEFHIYHPSTAYLFDIFALLSMPTTE